ncbi:MAG TPA: hypothetical protein VJ124_18265 [Pyrinomonadaceae bacterium]|nr:hypothetical protein [Pyrinomonadaceae bacterium]
MFINLRKWLSKVLTDSLTSAFTQLISVFLLGVFTALAGITLVALSNSLNTVISAPVYLLLILGMFAFLGILVPITRIVSLLDNWRRESAEKPPKSSRSQTLRFEDFPREWRAHVWKADKKWQVDSPQVYCSQHNLKLAIRVYPEDPRNSRSSLVVSTHCSDCEKEKMRYKEHWPFGTAFHSSNDAQTLEEEVQNRYVRQAEEMEQKRV